MRQRVNAALGSMMVLMSRSSLGRAFPRPTPVPISARISWLALAPRRSFRGLELDTLAL
jgi:hypothetical protein